MKVNEFFKSVKAKPAAAKAGTKRGGEDVEPETKKAKTGAKTGAKAEPKAKAPAKTAPVATPALATPALAESLLASIPDADLPDPDPNAPASNFAKFKAMESAKSTPAAYSGPLPEGRPNCLAGLTIVFTGQLPTLDRSTLAELATRYGARVTGSISGKTTLVVLGADAGPLKVKKIKLLGIKATTEEGFLQLIAQSASDGGDLEAAAKARAKREAEEQKAIAEAVKMEQEEAAKQALELTPAPNSQLWTVKYAPTNVSQLCGNKGAVTKLTNWLSNWFEYAKHDFKDGGPDGMGTYRAVLISGPPGIGKTTAAHLVAKLLGFDVLEKNASDVRSKLLLNATVKLVLDNTLVVGYFSAPQTPSANNKRFCLIMDEVDGMLAGDHGGAGQLSAFCRTTHMPIILICNDKSLPKMRTFDKSAFDLVFRRPDAQLMRARLMTIAHREHIKLDPNVIPQLVEATHNDIRQIITLLLTVLRTKSEVGFGNGKEIADEWAKHVALKPFDIVGRLLAAGLYGELLHTSLGDKIDLYFNDMDFTPLMVQENYLATRPSRGSTKSAHLLLVARAADLILQLDLVNSLIRGLEQQWLLLPFHAVMLLVRPGLLVAGLVTRIEFAKWLGQNLRSLKFSRMLQELQYHTTMRTLVDKVGLRLDYIPVLNTKLRQPLEQRQAEGIDDTIAMLDYYYLSREDWDNMSEMMTGAKSKDKLTTATKSAFTRKYNKGTHPVAIYHSANSVVQQTKLKVDYDGVVEDDTVKSEDEEETSDLLDLDKDKLVKAVKPKARGKAGKVAKVVKPKAKAKK